MSNRKILFFDIDGTLLSEEENIIPNSTIEALAKVKQNGHLVFINTGRPKATVPQEIKDLNPDGYVCGCGTYIEYHQKELLHKTLTNKRCHEIINDLLVNKIAAVLEGKHQVSFINPINHQEVSKISDFYTNLNYNIIDIGDKMTFDKFTIFFNDESDIASFKKTITDFNYIVRGSYMGEIVPLGYSKATGIQCLLDFFKLNLDDAYVFGDSSNDKSMLDYVKYSIVMGNGQPELFNDAYFVTKKLDEDGIEFALNFLCLI